MRNYLIDLGERVVATYLYMYITLLLATGFDLTDISALKAAAISCIPAGLAVIKGGIARFVGNPDTASLTDF